MAEHVRRGCASWVDTKAIKLRGRELIERVQGRPIRTAAGDVFVRLVDGPRLPVR